MIESGYLYIILLVAFVPVFLVIARIIRLRYFKDEPLPPQTFIKFQAKKRNGSWIIVGGSLILILAFKFSYFQLVVAFFFIREVLLFQKINKMDREKTLVYDVEGGIFEYKEDGHVSVFKIEDIQSILLHSYLFTFAGIKVADLYVGGKILRISSALVDFNTIPLLNPDITIRKRYYLSMSIPAVEF